MPGWERADTLEMMQTERVTFLVISAFKGEKQREKPERGGFSEPSKEARHE